MDTAVVPAVGSWDLENNGVDRAIDSIFWDSPTVLRLVSAVGAVGVNPVTIELLVEDANLHRLGGGNVLPFGPETLVELP